MSRFTITITEVTQERRTLSKQWVKGAGADGDYGYAPEVETLEDIEREIYSQNVAEIDVAAVVAVVNSKSSN